MENMENNKKHIVMQNHQRLKKLGATTIPVCWKMQGTEDIYWSLGIEIRGDEIYFENSEHVSIKDCYFTEEQCRLAYDLPFKNWKDKKEFIVERCQLLIKELEIIKKE